MNLFVYLFVYCANKFVVVCDVTDRFKHQGDSKPWIAKHQQQDTFVNN